MNAAVSWIRRVAALVAVIALVVAVPAALVAWGRLGSLTQLDWRVLWTSSDGGALLLAGLTVIGWWAWLCVVSCLVGELAAHASCGRVHIRVPSTGWFRPVAAVLMVAILGAGITAATPREALAAPAPAAPAPAAQAAPAQPSSVVQPSADAVAPRTPTVNHVVKSGDDLWSLAQQYLGDGSQWRQIVAANATLLDPASDLPVGAVLAIPVPDAPIPVAPPPVMPDQAPGTNQTMVVVRAGDSLWSLAQQYLGDGGRWPALFEANRTVVSDPGVIRPGWELRLPGGTDAAPETVVVRAGDSLWSLAQQYLGDGGRWPALFEANRAVVSDPEAIQPGLQLRLPGAPEEPRTDEAEAEPEVAAATSQPAPILAPADQLRGDQVQSDRREPAPAAAQVDERSDAEIERGMLHEVLGPIGMALAGLLLAAIVARRQLALRRRPLGRRLPHTGEATRRFENALAKQAFFVEDDADAAVSLPARRAAVDDPTGTSVRLGTEDAAPACDLAGVGMLSVVGPDETATGVVAAVASQLVVGDPETSPDVVLVGPSFGWLGDLSDGAVEVLPGPKEGLAALQRSVDERRLYLDGAASTSADLPHTVYCFDTALPETSVDPSALEAVALTAVAPARRALPGSQALLVDEAGTACWAGGDPFEAQALTAQARSLLSDLVGATSGVRTEPAPWWDGRPSSATRGEPTAGDVLPFFAANLSGASFRDGRVLSASDDCNYIDSEIIGCDLPINPARPPTTDRIQDPTMNRPATATHPHLLLLGPVDVANARGLEPARAAKSCAEYLGWLMMHPGRTAIQMSRDLMVAEGTRRSNMSRLRNWLGEMPDGTLYLPDAYSGRLAVDPVVGTDWDDFLLLLTGGVSSCPDEALEAALLMLRGAPFADAAPNQWHWAEQWRVDMACTVRDVGAVLAQRALDRHDLDTARWAASRALVAAPEDEVLMMLRIRTEHMAGNRAEVQRLSLHVTRQARELGIDLSDDMVALLQQVAEGAARLHAI